MAFTIGSGTFTNGSATVTGVTLTSGTLAYFASGTRMVVGVNPVIQEVEAIAAPSVSTITLRSAWTGTGGTYSFLANQTSEGLRDAVQAIRTNNVSLQSFIDSIDTAATANSVAQRTADGSINAVNVYASGNLGVGTSSPTDKLNISSASNQIGLDTGDQATYGTLDIGHFQNGAFIGTQAGSNAASNLMRFGTSGAERLRIDSSGNVGIGTTAPRGYANLNTLTINGTNGSVIDLEANGVHTGELFSNASEFSFAFKNNSDLAFYGNATERMRITNSGNVGIGTSSPAQKIHIKGSGAYDGQVFADNSSTTGSGIFSVGVNGTSVGFFATSGSAVGDTSTDLAMLAGPGNGLRFYSNETERMRIDSSGNIIIGTSIPPGTINSTAIRKGDAGQLILVANNGGLYHQAVGDYYLVTTAGGSTSDKTLKKNIKPLSGALEKVCLMSGVNFEFIDEPKCTADQGVQIGVIAQEVEAQFPEIVLTDDEGKKTVRYDRLVAPLIEAIKEQQAIIDDLKARIEALEG